MVKVCELGNKEIFGEEILMEGISTY